VDFVGIMKLGHKILMWSKLFNPG